MSGKTPHWPGTDGKPDASFGPKSLPKTEDGKPAAAGTGEDGSSTPRLDAAMKNQPGQVLVMPGRNTKQVNRTGRKPSQSEEPQQGGEKPAIGAKVASQAPPGPVDEKRPDVANPKQPNRPKQSNRPNQRTPRPVPQQIRAALLGTQPGRPAGAQRTAGATTGAVAAGAAKVAGDTAKATPWAATSTAGELGKAAKGKPHKPEGTLSKAGEAHRTRKVRLHTSRVNPWSVMKTTFLFSIVFGIMLVVIVAVLWAIVAGSGALQSINSTMTQLLGDSESQSNVEDCINTGRVIGFAAVLAALGVIIVTAVSTLPTFLYDLAAVVIGGLEVILAED